MPEAAINNRNSETLRRLTSSPMSKEEDAATRNTNSYTGLASGVWASFLAFAGLGAGAGVKFESNQAASYQFVKLTSRIINPSVTDIEAIFAEPEVQSSLRNSRFESSLYMITGVQVASGTHYMIAEAKSRGRHLHFSADLPPAGFPVAIGVGRRTAARSEQGATGHIQGEFVFSYRLREIRYKRKAVSEVRECHGGDLFSKDSERLDTQDDPPQEYNGAESPYLRPENPELPDLLGMYTETAPQDADGDEVLCAHVVDND